MEIRDTKCQNNTEKEQSWRTHTSQFQNLTQSNQMVWYWHKDKHIDKWNSPKYNSQSPLSQLSFKKGT